MTSTATPTTQHRVTRQNGDTLDITGQLVARTTSERDYHAHDGAHAPRGQRCSACRFFVLEIYVCPTGPHRYVAHTTGVTRVPGEDTRHRLHMTDSAYELVELLTARSNGHTFIPRDTARALAIAAEVDDGLREAYINRAV